MSNIIRFQFKFLETHTHTHSNENNDKIQQSVVASNWQGYVIYLLQIKWSDQNNEKEKLNKKQTNILKIVKVSCWIVFWIKIRIYNYTMTNMSRSIQSLFSTSFYPIQLQQILEKKQCHFIFSLFLLYFFKKRLFFLFLKQMLIKNVWTSEFYAKKGQFFANHNSSMEINQLERKSFFSFNPVFNSVYQALELVNC